MNAPHVEHAVRALAEFVYKEHLLKTFPGQEEFDNPEPEKPTWMSRNGWAKALADMRATVATLVWLPVLDDYQMQKCDALVYRFNGKLYALRDPTGVSRA